MCSRGGQICSRVAKAPRPLLNAPLATCMKAFKLTCNICICAMLIYIYYVQSIWSDHSSEKLSTITVQLSALVKFYIVIEILLGLRVQLYMYNRYKCTCANVDTCILILHYHKFIKLQISHSINMQCKKPQLASLVD